MTLASLMFFTHIYGATTAPAYVEPAHAIHHRVADHGFNIVTPEWRRLTLQHTMTTYWGLSRFNQPFVASAQYNVELKFRVGRTTLTAAHESWHNADVAGADKEWNRLGLEVKL